MFCIADVLSAEQLREVRRLLAEQPYQSGSKTAGWAATLVKNNEQLDPKGKHFEKLQQLIVAALAANEVFTLAAMPKALRPITFSRYTSGMGYGDHVDNALMGEGNRIRSDLSFTLFLSAPGDYEGGELMIEDTLGTHDHKLDAGALVLYPSDTVHRVATVTSGVRQVAVGWVQSLIRDPRQRQILFDLEVLRRQLFQQTGKTAQFDSLSKSCSNLWRMWAEP
ncbi:Fe2+-dependent dioxygenase [Steroidobacter sp.]|uniref:Fe2+-dependent dioxygenase n=1 Tax=Steroidobacter sp. TaxID=1978227 RepID=UPI001A51405B|nr:Fe2+-dependent dioxygenase [Steroidobacter sp.]MBL8268732.1 Fe2+-dependent dioxygenase [Steroidobacter sp.]